MNTVALNFPFYTRTYEERLELQQFLVWCENECGQILSVYVTLQYGQTESISKWFINLSPLKNDVFQAINVLTYEGYNTIAQVLVEFIL